MNDEIRTLINSNELYSVNEVASYVKVRPETIRHWIRDGILTASRPGGTVRISGSAIQALLRGDDENV